jgi:DNA-binding transcriptional regulator YdaS (Cro superfamily)
MNEAMQKAVARAGGQLPLAREVERVSGEVCYRQSVAHWLKNQCSYHRVLDVERATGVPRYELRPDLYPPEEYREAG